MATVSILLKASGWRPECEVWCIGKPSHPTHRKSTPIILLFVMYILYMLITVPAASLGSLAMPETASAMGISFSSDVGNFFIGYMLYSPC
jgi:hypothetical protein